MTTHPYDPTEHARALYRENLRLRELLTLVAQDLERLASTNASPEWQRPLHARSMRIRERLHGELERPA